MTGNPSEEQRYELALRSAIEDCYRSQRAWAHIAMWSSLLAAGAIFYGARYAGIALMLVSLACQLLSASTRATARRLERRT